MEEDATITYYCNPHLINVVERQLHIRLKIKKKVQAVFFGPIVKVVLGIKVRNLKIDFNTGGTQS